MDIDLEGRGAFDADQAAYVAFVRTLSTRLHAEGKHLTLDTFSYHWNAPNQTWWPDLLPLVDGLTSMGYSELGSKAPEWRRFEFQKAAAGKYAKRLMIGLPADRNDWRGSSLAEHLEWCTQDGGVGVSFWDAQVPATGWHKPETWKSLGAIRGKH